ncbi:restriction endonuclease subunit S [Streptomyces sp. NBC_00726]|uniref:restriction endonuclease subunit S n=1 Tax=Streptomyces sp. NBC_00726 TaxID=2903674 RepID=UPI0038658F14
MESGNAAHVPDGWVERSLGELCDVITDGTHHTPTYVPRGIPFFSVESVTNGEFVNVKHISPEEHRRLISRCRPQRGDILMTRIGSLADTKLLDWDVEASIYVSLALLRPGPKIDGRYLYVFTKSRRFVKAVEDRSLLWAIPKKINMGDIAHVPICLPVDPSEQKRIADAVFTADEYVQRLSRLLVKKQQIAQGLAQQLLTGSTRLAGFSAPWGEARLGDVARIKTGSRNNQDKTPSGPYPFFVRSANVERIDSYSYDCEAILVPGEGGIGSIFHYIVGKFEAHQRVYVINDFGDSVNGRFVFQYMKHYFGAHAMENSVKATVDSLRLPTFKMFPLAVPELAEQEAIARALDDAGAEIRVLTERLTKARAVKVSLMQELLTGRTQLPVGTEEAK